MFLSYNELFYYFKNNKINVLLSIFITGALILSSLGISSSAFAQPLPLSW